VAWCGRTRRPRCTVSSSAPSTTTSTWCAVGDRRRGTDRRANEHERLLEVVTTWGRSVSRPRHWTTSARSSTCARRASTCGCAPRTRHAARLRPPPPGRRRARGGRPAPAYDPHAGHTPGSICSRWWHAVLFSGDTLFPGPERRVSRRRLPHIITSIEERLFRPTTATPSSARPRRRDDVGVERPHVDEWVARGCRRIGK